MSARLCLVGYGAIARHHAEIFKAEGAELVSIVGRVAEDAASFAREFGFRDHTTDLAEALARDDFDAVVVASPSELHFAQARQALVAGKHLLVRSAGDELLQGQELVDLAEQHHRLLMVAHSERYIPSLATVREQASTGALPTPPDRPLRAAPARERRLDGPTANWTVFLLVQLLAGDRCCCAVVDMTYPFTVSDSCARTSSLIVRASMGNPA